MDEITERFIDRFGQRKKEEKITFDELGEILNLSSQMVKKIFAKNAGITPDKLWKLIFHFDMVGEVTTIMKGGDTSSLFIGIGQEEAIQRKLDHIIEKQQETNDQINEIKEFFDKAKQNKIDHNKDENNTQQLGDSQS